MERLRTITVQGERLQAAGMTYECRIGRAGITADKQEGDLMTPAGSFAMRFCYYRPDRVPPPKTHLPLIALEPDDGWCDDPTHVLYNQAVKLPFEAGHEKLWREDGLYDVIVPLGYNDDPVVPGKGSAIFLHVMRDDGVGTEGCVALTREDLLDVLRECSASTRITVSAILPAGSPAID